jgi:ElaB/YqjD/DUF883 family membrane-anchored ribosome-binding protein
MTQQKPGYGQESAADRLRDTADMTTDRFKDTAERGGQTASNVTEQARYYGEKAQDAVQQFKPLLQRSLKEQPMTTLAGAAVVGFLLGALWKR